MAKLKKRHFLLGIILAVVVIIGTVFLLSSNSTAPGTRTVPSDSTPVNSVKDQPEPFDKTEFSTSKPSSLWVVVNKQRPLPSTYTPAKLRTPNMPLRSSGSEMLLRYDAAAALEAMVSAAKEDGVSLMLASGYRSYGLQQAVYNNFVRQDGVAAANRYSAKPGHSEHQTGLGADVGSTDRVCELETCFAQTKAGKWVAENASKYGFIIRYEKGNEKLVGYQFEPWHLRYVGKKLATELVSSGQTMEQFFGLPNAPDYR